MMIHDGILGLRRNPHAASRSLLLKVDFVQGPQVHSIVGHQFSEFFYASSDALDLLSLIPDEAYGGGTQTAGTAAGIGARPVGLHRPCRSRPTVSCHPRGSLACPRRWVWSATPD